MAPTHYLGSKGYVLLKSELDPKQLSDIKNELTVSPFSPDGYGVEPVIFQNYLESTNKLYVPKYYGLQKFGVPSICKINEGNDIDLEFTGTLRPLQVEAVGHVLQACRDPSKMGGLLCLACGQGKTICAVSMICTLAKKTLIIVHKDFLLQQWKERINEFTNSARIGLIKAKVIDVENKDIVLASLQSLSMKDYNEELFKEFGFVIIDECFPYRQSIVTENGPIAIGRLYNMWKNKESLPLIKSFNIDKKIFEWKAMTYAWEKQAEELLVIKFSKNNIKCTPNHKILTPNGMIEAEKLKIGDLVIANYDNTIKENACARALNDDQYQILLGSILGDGSIGTLPSERYRLSFTHGFPQKDYCDWKANMFGETTHVIDNNGYSQKKAVVFSTKIIDLDKDIPKKKNIIPQWIIDDIDARGIAIWYMDDGNLDRCTYRATLHTNTFNLETQEMFVEKFKSYDIDCTIHSSKKYYYLLFNTVNTLKLFNLIGIYIHSSMTYKIINDILSIDSEQYNSSIKSNYRNCRNINPNIIKENEVYIVKGKEFICEIYETNRLYIHCKGSRSKKKYFLNNLPIFDITKISSYIWNETLYEYGTMKISSITRTNKWKDGHGRKNTQNVYDIEVADNHNFICCGETSLSGICVKNCHHIGSEVFSRALKKVNFKYSIGLSATPKRKDGLTKVFTWYLGDIAYISEKRSDSVHVVFHEYNNNNPNYSEEHKLWNQKLNMAKMINNICEFPDRIDFLVKLIADTLTKEPERRVLLLSDRRQHLHLIHDALSKNNIESGFYYGGLSEGQLKDAETKTVILATFQYASEGFDMKGLDTLVLASPKSDIVQVVGRILRDKPEDRKHIPQVIDIVDNFSMFPNQAKKRNTYYKSCKYTIDNPRSKPQIKPKSASKSASKKKTCIILDDEDDFM